MFQSLASRANALKRQGPWRHSALPALWLITDEASGVEPLAAAQRLPGGCGIVLRHYRHPGRAALALALSRIARNEGHLLLVGADWRLAEEVGAHGVHLPGWARSRLRAPVPYRGLVSTSVHNLRELGIASRLRADLAFASPAFPTQSHPDTRALGPLRLAALAHASNIPLVALGGITEGNAHRLRTSGVLGIAGVRLFAARAR